MKRFTIAGSYRRLLALFCLILLGGEFSGVRSASAADLKVTFGANGIASIRHGPVELLDPRSPGPSILYVRYAGADDKVEQLYQPPVTKQSFDFARSTLTQTYGWGTVQYVYTVRGNRIDEIVTVANSSPKMMSDIAVFPIKFLLPRTHLNLLGYPVSRAVFEDGFGSIMVLNQDFENGTQISGYPSFKSQTDKQVIPVLMTLPQPRKAKHPIVDNEKFFNSPGRMIPPGKSDTYHISMVFGPAGGKVADLAPDYAAAYAKAKPMKLSWPDRRPMGAIYLANSNMGWKKNPRGYLFGKGAENDITTPEGLAVFAKGLDQYADTCVKNLKSMNAQGVIVWDLEGGEFWHPLTYMGDPRMLARVAPEMDKLADAFLKKFTAAGLKVGLTIRPTEIFYREGQTPRFWHRDVKDPVALMSEKMTYAQKRWGVTIFYLDSNVFGPGFDTKLPPDHGVPWTMPSSMIEQLHTRHPDCLVIPEWSDIDCYRFSAPYSAVNLRELGTAPEIRSIYPGAFRLVSVNPELIQNNWETLLNAVQGGDVLLLPAWYMPPENELCGLLYREAALRKQGMPAGLREASSQTLIEKSRSVDEATRYHAASLLGQSAEVGTDTALISLLQDSSPLVRKSALVALQQRKAISDTKLMDDLGTWLEKPGNSANAALRSFVADALGHFGNPAVPRLLAILQNETGEAAPYAYRALGQTGTDRPQAVDALLKPLQKPVGADLNQESAIKALGEIKARAAVPALLTVLKDNNRDHESIRRQAVIALGRIGDKAAIGPLVAEYSKSYSSTVVYSIPPSLEDALRALTGQRRFVGADEWRQWWTQQRK